MTYIVSSGALNSTHSLTQLEKRCTKRHNLQSLTNGYPDSEMCTRVS